MTGDIIETSSYSEAMDLSDLEDCYYDQKEECMLSSQMSPIDLQKQPEAPVKIRKKPGRKPNPASPALRKAQNRAAQRAFRERKERHMKDLESSMRGIQDDHDRLLRDNENMSSENEILKAENWYLKGIVLSLQLVCLQHNLVIPRHCPHVNDETLAVLAQSIPESISSYLNVNSRNKLPLLQKLMKESPEISNLHLQPQKQPQPPQQPYPSGSLIITQDGVHKVPNKQRQSDLNNPSSESPNAANTLADFSKSTMPSSSIVETDKHGSDGASKNMFGTENDREVFVAAPSEPITSNLAAIQTLRLRLRLQSACVRMQSIPFAIQPTLLQLTIPHDPRIDLVPTPHMRDRMILYRDQFDLDDCFRCLLGGSVFHGGDPAVAGNWQLPEEFFKKYWFLTIDYNLRRYTNEWRKKQGLKEINGDIPTLQGLQQPGQYNTHTSQFTPSIPVQQPLHQQYIPSGMYTQPPPPLQNVPQNCDKGSMAYDDISDYLDLQWGREKSRVSATTATTSTPCNDTGITPVQLMNGYQSTTEQQQNYNLFGKV